MNGYDDVDYLLSIQDDIARFEKARAYFLTLMVKEIEILDTTLRDGEQTSGVSFAVREKLSMAACCSTNCT